MRGVFKRVRRSAMAVLLVMALGAAGAQAQSREDPRSRERSLVTRILVWVMDTLSFPPG